MTVDELIEQLQELSDDGRGDLQVEKEDSMTLKSVEVLRFIDGLEIVYL